MKPYINQGKNTNEENDLNGHRPGKGFVDGTCHRGTSPKAYHGHRGSNWKRDATTENVKVEKQATASDALETCKLQEPWLCNNCQALGLTGASAEEFGTTGSLCFGGENAGQSATLEDSLTISKKLKVLLI